MKCEPAPHGPCKRCRNSKIECIFKPRANARRSTSILDIFPSRSTEALGVTSPEVLERLAVIEAVLGIERNNTSNNANTSIPRSNSPSSAASLDEQEANQGLEGLWHTAAILKRYTPPDQRNLWSRSVVSQLWLS
jgi:hypothetical protein